MRSPWVIGVGPKSYDKCPYWKGNRWAKRSHVKTQGGAGARCHSHCADARTARKASCGGSEVRQHLDFQLLASRTGTEKCLRLRSLSLWRCMAALGPYIDNADGLSICKHPQKGSQEATRRRHPVSCSRGGAGIAGFLGVLWLLLPLGLNCL